METRDSIEPESNKLLSHYWDLNSDSYSDQISFNWKNNEIRIDIHSFCDPPGNNKSIHFDFYINGEHSLLKFLYNCYGGAPRGKPPHLQSENFQLAFHANPSSLEVFEYNMRNECDNTAPHDRANLKRKDLWISVYEDYRSGMRCEAPFKDSKIKFWIKKSYNYQYFSGVLMFKYELYTSNLFFIPPMDGNFTCHHIFDHCKSTGCGVDTFIGCEISDKKGVYRKYFWSRSGLEELTIFEIIKFFQSLRTYYDWNDFDQFQDSCKAIGVLDTEVNSQILKEINKLGLTREKE